MTTIDKFLGMYTLYINLNETRKYQPDTYKNEDSILNREQIYNIFGQYSSSLEKLINNSLKCWGISQSPLFNPGIFYLESEDCTCFISEKAGDTIYEFTISPDKIKNLTDDWNIDWKSYKTFRSKPYPINKAITSEVLYILFQEENETTYMAFAYDLLDFVDKKSIKKYSKCELLKKPIQIFTIWFNKEDVVPIPSYLLKNEENENSDSLIKKYIDKKYKKFAIPSKEIERLESQKNNSYMIEYNTDENKKYKDKIIDNDEDKTIEKTHSIRKINVAPAFRGRF